MQNVMGELLFCSACADWEVCQLKSAVSNAQKRADESDLELVRNNSRYRLCEQYADVFGDNGEIIFEYTPLEEPKLLTKIPVVPEIKFVIPAEPTGIGTTTEDIAPQNEADHSRSTTINKPLRGPYKKRENGSKNSSVDTTTPSIHEAINIPKYLQEVGLSDDFHGWFNQILKAREKYPKNLNASQTKKFNREVGHILGIHQTVVITDHEMVAFGYLVRQVVNWWRDGEIPDQFKNESFDV